MGQFSVNLNEKVTPCLDSRLPAQSQKGQNPIAWVLVDAVNELQCSAAPEPGEIGVRKVFQENGLQAYG
jgi:hypothetical protein